MAKAAENLFYIGISHKTELRRNVLESSKEIIQAIKAYRHIKELEEEKRSMTEDLKRIMADIRKLDNRLREQLPRIEQPKGKQAKQLAMKKQATSKAEKIILPNKKTIVISQNQERNSSRTSEINKLEQELMAIEDKLRSLR